MNLKKVAAGAAMTGALGFIGLGLGAGVANAAPESPVTGILWQQDHGDGGDWGHGDRGGDWGDRGNWGYGGGNWGYGGNWGCITGPFGHLTWCP